jgi:hypothetical protein
MSRAERLHVTAGAGAFDRAITVPDNVADDGFVAAFALGYRSTSRRLHSRRLPCTNGYVWLDGVHGRDRQPDPDADAGQHVGDPMACASRCAGDLHAGRTPPRTPAAACVQNDTSGGSGNVTYVTAQRRQVERQFVADHRAARRLQPAVRDLRGDGRRARYGSCSPLGRRTTGNNYHTPWFLPAASVARPASTRSILAVA